MNTLEQLENEQIIFQLVPFDSWINIISFINDVSNLINTSKVCKMFYEMHDHNLLW